MDSNSAALENVNVKKKKVRKAFLILFGSLTLIAGHFSFCLRTAQSVPFKYALVRVVYLGRTGLHICIIN